MMRRGRHGAVAILTLAALLVAGVLAAQELTICEVQEYDASGYSPYNGETVTVRGIVTFPPGYVVPGDPPGHTSMYIQSGGCGINIFCYDEPASVNVALGDSIRVTGQVEEYVGSSAGATTEISCDSAADIVRLVEGARLVEPLELALSNAMIGEDLEGVLVRTVGVITLHQGFKIELDGLDDPVIYQGYNDSTDFSVFEAGDTLDVTGVVLQYDRNSPYLEDYEIVPRFQSDMAHYTAIPPPYVGFSSGVEISFREITAVDTAGVAVTGDEKAPVFYPDIGEILPIYYKAPGESRTIMKLYDLQGRLVRTLLDEDYDGYSGLPNHYERLFPYRMGVRGWDGRDDLRRLAPAGTYICRFEATEPDGATAVATAPLVVGARLK
jgi:hypothetical protein